MKERKSMFYAGLLIITQRSDATEQVESILNVTS